MLRAGYDYVPYASVERVIEDNKAEYYLAHLRRDSKTGRSVLTSGLYRVSC